MLRGVHEVCLSHPILSAEFWRRKHANGRKVALPNSGVYLVAKKHSAALTPERAEFPKISLLIDEKLWMAQSLHHTPGRGQSYEN